MVNPECNCVIARCSYLSFIARNEKDQIFLHYVVRFYKNNTLYMYKPQRDTPLIGVSDVVRFVVLSSQIGEGVIIRQGSGMALN